ncbi:MAG: hypothetical protein ABEJ42_09395 [Halobacteriaceae archaeon]
MFEDPDRALDAVGVFLAVGLLVGGGVAVLAAMNADTLAADPPDASWRLERVNESHARIVHAGGEPVETEALSVIVVRYERPVNWTGALFEGDGGVVRAHVGESVSLVWDGGRGDTVRLARWPDARPRNATATPGGPG